MVFEVVKLDRAIWAPESNVTDNTPLKVTLSVKVIVALIVCPEV